MGSTTKRTSKTSKAKPRPVAVKAPVAKPPESNAELRRKLETRDRELAESLKRENATAIENVRLFTELGERNTELREALEHQTATAEVLGIISRSPTDVQPVLDAIVESAARVCGIDDVVLRLREKDVMVARAHFGPIPLPRAAAEIGIDVAAYRWVREHSTLHIPDVRAQNEFPTVISAANFRTYLAAPLRHQGELIGLVVARRTEVRPFTAAQIKLLETFADQAVIALENVRLFEELKESLEQQTATSEILGVIASSPADVQPVLDAVAANAARLCDANNAGIWLTDGENCWPVVFRGDVPVPRIGSRPMVRESNVARAMIDREIIHTPDMLSPEARAAFPGPSATAERLGIRTALIAPLLREGVAIGAIHLRRTEIRPFTDKQIELLKTFGDQAVIAIENVRLFKELQERNRDLAEALEQQTATGEVLRVIASSPTELQPVLDTVIENAVTLSGANHGHIRQIDGEILRLAAHYNESPEYLAHLQSNPIRVDQSLAGRAFLERRPIQHLATSEQAGPPSLTWSDLGDRAILAVPLLKEETPIGNILIWRDVVEPFTERQIELVKTFADQAVIAIENVRLFKELQERNAELRETLEHQTATAEVLGIISRSPTDVQPVLDAIVESAARVCGIDDVVLRLHDRKTMVPRAHFGSVPMGRYEISVDEPQYHWMREHGTLHIPDVLAQNDFPMLGAVSGTRTLLRVPLRQKGELIGTLGTRRTEVRPFTPAQIKLLETFADQAVIAIENVRLFKELQERNRDLTEALEQQTATSEILRVIASSPTDLQPVLDAVAENAARLCDANDTQIYRAEGNQYWSVAKYGTLPVPNRREVRTLVRNRIVGRALIDRETIHIHDMSTSEAHDEFPGTFVTVAPWGVRTSLVTPLLREGTAIGAILIRRVEVRPFSEKQIALLKTFADQAVIAIENVRLFQELKESLEQQTATSEVLGVIASSPTNIQPVLNTVAANAARLCEATDAQIRLIEGDASRLVASFGNVPAPEFRPTIPGSVSGRAIFNRETVHVHDLQEATKSEFPESVGARFGVRTMLCTPMLRKGSPIGVITVRRTEVRPFSEKQIKLLETFASQAVIAIENVRLFKELDERTNELTRSVGELRALGEVSQAVSSTLDLETVLTRIVSHAVQLSGTDGGAIYEYDEPSQEFHLRATDHMEEELITALRNNPPRLGDGVVGRAAANREPVQVPNILEEHAYAPRMRQILERFGFRASLAVPLLREDRIIGGLVVRRKATGEFRPEVIELLKTFATQSVLAIQNARLFREIEEKSQQIQAANRHKSEFLANMSHELRTPLNAIIGFSEVLQERLFGDLNDKQAEYTDDILTSGRHLLSLINEILDLSKVEAGRMELELAPFDLPLAIDNARTFVRERATNHEITLEVKVD